MGTGVNDFEYDSSKAVSTKYSTKKVDTTVDSDNSSYMDFDSYLKLLVAQMSNQDFNDPMSDAEVLNQMATYSMLEGIKNMTSQSNISYASSLVGKAVTVANNDVYDTGIVDSVIISGGKPYIIVNGVSHEISNITDVSDMDKYNSLKDMLGQTVQSTDDKGNVIQGIVTNILIIGGVDFVVIDKQTLCTKSSVQIVENTDTDDTETNIDENEGAENQNTGTVNSGDDDDSDEITVNPAEASYTGSVDGVAYSSYEARAQALYDELMKTLDSTSYNTDEVSETEMIYNPETEHVYITNIDVPEYAAAVYGEEDELLQSLSIGNDLQVNNSNSEYYGSVSKQSSSNYQPITTSNCVPFRKNAHIYTYEAELADSYGTRMYDIRWITNTAITSRIKTNEVIGYTSSGRSVTDLGFSGVGKLGEVVTFSDGTQRVEIIHNNGNSSWLNTTGKYTLDELCNTDYAPKGMTPYETAIRNYGIKETMVNKYGLNSGTFASYLRSIGVSVTEN